MCIRDRSTNILAVITPIAKLDHLSFDSINSFQGIPSAKETKMSFGTKGGKRLAQIITALKPTKPKEALLTPLTLQSRSTAMPCFETIDPSPIHEKILRKKSSMDLPRIRALYGGPCLLYTSPSPRDRQKSRMPSSA
eukprot:TRINITY_DN19681_c0_g1_i2.p1 TRINITY_DN19681_c0_g1~~TRINITY_DN19681_c0_g1_i2.p1  ORF type:complete len:137 (-),score=20.98 TRINITY_DN19681_c0_g1_i2:9-419(-)